MTIKFKLQILTTDRKESSKIQCGPRVLMLKPAFESITIREAGVIGTQRKDAAFIFSVNHRLKFVLI